MFIKKVGNLLLVRLKLFHILSKLAPVFLIISLLLPYITVRLSEEYKFQEPSLKTKIFDIVEKNANEDVPFLQAFEGIKYAKVEGLLDNECLLITFPASMQQSQEVKNIYKTYLNQNHKAKNLVLLSYSHSIKLYSFFEWYFNPRMNYKLSFGIIRAGLNIQLQDGKTELEGEESKDKAFLKIYSSTLHPDLDYFQALKELLQKLSIVWSPCEKIHRSGPLKQIKRAFTSLQGWLLGQKQLKHFYDHVLCELDQHLNIEPSAHESMMINGFQAGTVRFLGNSGKKIEKFVISFVNEFGMQEDHLHSAISFYYPISKTYFAPLLTALYPSLLFFIAIVLFLLRRFISNDYKNSMNFEPGMLFLVYVMVCEYCCLADYTFSILLAIVMVGLSALLDIYSLFTRKTITNNRYYEIGLIAIQGLISIYFGVFCFSLSYISMLLTLVMLIKPSIPFLRIAMKISLISLCIIYAGSLDHLASTSAQLKLCFLVLLAHLWL